MINKIRDGVKSFGFLTYLFDTMLKVVLTLDFTGVSLLVILGIFDDILKKSPFYDMKSEYFLMD